MLQVGNGVMKSIFQFNLFQEMKTQCFGGEYMGEVFDHMMKRYGTVCLKLIHCSD